MRLNFIPSTNMISIQFCTQEIKRKENVVCKPNLSLQILQISIHSLFASNTLKAYKHIKFSISDKNSDFDHPSGSISKTAIPFYPLKIIIIICIIIHKYLIF